MPTIVLADSVSAIESGSPIVLARVWHSLFAQEDLAGDSQDVFLCAVAKLSSSGRAGGDFCQ